jgi:hypothetical protein
VAHLILPIPLFARSRASGTIGTDRYLELIISGISATLDDATPIELGAELWDTNCYPLRAGGLAAKMTF